MQRGSKVAYSGMRYGYLRSLMRARWKVQVTGIGLLNWKLKSAVLGMGCGLWR